MVVTLSAEGKGTRYTCQIMHASAALKDKHVELGFEMGWTAALAQFDEMLRGGAAS